MQLGKQHQVINDIGSSCHLYRLTPAEVASGAKRGLGGSVEGTKGTN